MKLAVTRLALQWLGVVGELEIARSVGEGRHRRDRQARQRRGDYGSSHGRGKRRAANKEKIARRPPLK